MNCVVYLKSVKKLPIYWLIPLFWIHSGALAALACVIAKWILVGKKKAGEAVPIWSQRITLDNTWQAIRTIVGYYFMDMTSGSFWFMLWMNEIRMSPAYEEGVEQFLQFASERSRPDENGKFFCPCKIF